MQMQSLKFCKIVSVLHHMQMCEEVHFMLRPLIIFRAGISSLWH